MRASSALTIAVLAVLAVFAVTAMMPMSGSDAAQDADAVITQSGNTVTVTYRDSEVHSIDYNSGSDIIVFDFGSVEGSISVVLDGAKVGNLTLFHVTAPGDIYHSLAVDFRMVSGSVRTLSLISFDGDAVSSLETSYDRLDTLFRSVSMTFESGEVGEICPTAHMVAVSGISYDLGPGMAVDRMLPSGVNGKYGTVYVCLNGATVGYMSNVSSRVGALDYEIRTGSISYFAIGANTEHNQSSALSAKSTFIATGDVSVRIGPLADIYRCIIGAGVLNTPSIICNAEVYSEPAVHNVNIDASGVDVYNDTLFFTDNRKAALSMSSYSIGRSPSYTFISEKCTYSKSVIDVYGPDGIWSSPSSSSVTPGVSVYLNADFVISAGTLFTVFGGGYLSNSGFIELAGSLINSGRFDSSGVIQCDTGSVLTGPIGGKAIVADAVYFPSPTESLSVMVNASAAAIIQELPSSVSYINALLDSGNRSVSVKTSESQRIFGDRFVLGLESIDAPGSFESAYRLDIIGIDYSVLSSCTVSVTISTDAGKCTAVYISNGSGYDVIATCEYESSVTFQADGSTVFYTLTYESDNPPMPVKPTNFKVLDYILCAMIIALGITILYVLSRMRRKNDA